MPKSRKKRKARKRILAFPDLEQAKSTVLNTLIEKWAKNLRSRDHGIRRVVLLGAKIGVVQTNSRSALQDQSRTETIRAVDD